jgi:hypothetical protein
VGVGLKFLHKLLVRNLLAVHPRCVTLIQSFERYKRLLNDPHGHALDALRYGLDDYIFARPVRSSVTTVRF